MVLRTPTRSVSTDLKERLWRRCANRAEAGVGNDNVKVPELGNAIFEGGSNGVAISDVTLARNDPPACLFDRVDCLVEVGLCRHCVGRVLVGLGHIDADDVGALFS